MLTSVRSHELTRVVCDGNFLRNCVPFHPPANLVEELGDVLGNVIIIANKYNISLEEVFSSHKEKLAKRYAKEE